MQKIKFLTIVFTIMFLTIVFTIMFFTGNLCAQEVIKNTYTGENIVLTEQQKMWVNKAENEGYLLAVSNNWWNIENYYYNVQQKTITADRIYHTVLYGLILIGLFGCALVIIGITYF